MFKSVSVLEWHFAKFNQEIAGSSRSHVNKLKTYKVAMGQLMNNRVWTDFQTNTLVLFIQWYSQTSVNESMSICIQPVKDLHGVLALYPQKIKVNTDDLTHTCTNIMYHEWAREEPAENIWGYMIINYAYGNHLRFIPLGILLTKNQFWIR